MTDQDALETLGRAYKAFEAHPGPEQRKALLQAIQAYEDPEDLMRQSYFDAANLILARIDKKASQ